MRDPDGIWHTVVMLGTASNGMERRAPISSVDLLGENKKRLQ